MRPIAVVLLFAAGCVPDSCGTSGGSGGYIPDPPSCAPVADPTLTALAFAHPGGAPWAVGDRLDIQGGGQGLEMAHFTLALTGTVPSCVLPEVVVARDTQMQPRATSAVDGGATIEYFMGPYDLGSTSQFSATVDGRTITATVGNGVIQQID
jgi:hypothetical protein